MAVDLVSMPFSSKLDSPPSKRRRLGWDVPDPAILAEAARLQLCLASQLLQVCPSLVPGIDRQSSGLNKFHDHHKVCSVSEKIHDLQCKSLCNEVDERGLSGASASLPWREDDKDGHFNFDAGDRLTPRYIILQKMGEGTFGRVLECLDLEAQEVVAIKVVRSAEKYREAAMIEVGHLQTLARNDGAGSWGKAHKYFRHGRRLNWPDRYTSRESIRAVDRLPRLRDLLMKHVDKSQRSFVNLLERMFSYDPRGRLTAREALQHPFFQGPSER